MQFLCQLRSLISKQLCPLYSNGYSRYADRLRSALPPSGSCDIATIAKLQRHTAPAKPLHQFTCIHCKNRPSGIHTATLSRCGPGRSIYSDIFLSVFIHSFGSSSRLPSLHAFISLISRHIMKSHPSSPT